MISPRPCRSTCATYCQWSACRSSSYARKWYFHYTFTKGWRPILVDHATNRTYVSIENVHFFFSPLHRTIVRDRFSKLGRDSVSRDGRRSLLKLVLPALNFDDSIATLARDVCDPNRPSRRWTYEFCAVDPLEWTGVALYSTQENSVNQGDWRKIAVKFRWFQRI